LEAELKKAHAERDAHGNKVEELSGKLEALTVNLNSMAEDIKNKDTVLLSAGKQKVKLESSENEVTALRQQINKLELTKNSQLANRLQAEKEANEKNHGQRTALMGMLETQLSEVNEKNSEMNAKLEAPFTI
jgi:chromosome segregation ATPase